MDNTLASELNEIFCDNFVAYYRAHSCHINITGRNFMSDHALLGDIYEDLQSQIDTIGEFIRTLGYKAPTTITEILQTAELPDEDTVDSADAMLQLVLSSQEYLLEEWREIFGIATIMNDQDIANYAADRMGVHAKFIWKLTSTLEG